MRTSLIKRSLSNLASSTNAQKSFQTRKRLVYGQYEITPRRSVPGDIAHPDYAITGLPSKAPSHIVIYNELQLQKIRKSARLARKMLDFANSLAKPGVTTEEIDYMTHKEIVRHGAYPSPINYYGFPKAICTSVNEVVCHGIPDKRPLENGDMLSIDVSLYLDGYHGDNCGTVIVGKGDETSARLLLTTQLALDRAIQVCRPGAKLGEIGYIIEHTALENGFNVVHEFCGHGVGQILHMSPLVSHFGNDDDTELREGMVFTIEPILVEGDRTITVWEDNWTAVTVDGGRSAQFEHEVLITSSGAEILTIPEHL